MSAFLRLQDVDLRGKRVLVRADFNVPLDPAGRITDETRIHAAMPGLRLALEGGAAVMVTSHLGRPKEGQPEARDSLAPVAAALGRLMKRDVPLVRDWLAGVELAPGALVLLENCRLNPGEKADDDALARRIAALCDVYVNDAFACAHRAEATTAGVARHARIACAGPSLQAELDAAARVLHDPAQPLVVIVGGAKASTKLELLEALARKARQVFAAGALANTLLLARGVAIGRSLAEPALHGTARRLLGLPNLVLPVDAVVGRSLDDAAPPTRAVEAIGEDRLILDLGPRSLLAIERALAGAGTAVWNGPVGVFEQPGGEAGSRRVAAALADCPGFSVAGGGDTAAAIARYSLQRRIGHVSTGGGAFLEYLAGRTLPAVAALEAASARSLTQVNMRAPRQPTLG